MKNPKDNVCTFIPTQSEIDKLQVLHLVLETKTMHFDNWKTISHFKINLCLEGEGFFHTHSGEHQITKGTFFFCLPSTPFAIQSKKDFKFAYVAFMGEQALSFVHKFNLSVNNCVFGGFENLTDFWENSFNFPSELSELSAKGLLYYSLAQIASKTVNFTNEKKDDYAASLIKKYIDENFTDNDISLSTISKALSYNEKYISNVFSQKFNVNFKQYLNDIRVNNACNLIKKGFYSIKDVAFLCGFNDPLYFSKVFKSKMECSPTEFIVETVKQNERDNVKKGK